MGPVQLSPALAGNRQPDDVGALVSGQWSQVGEWREECRPESVGAWPLGLGDSRHPKLRRLLGTDGNTEPVARPRLQGGGQGGRDQYLVWRQILAQGGFSIGEQIGAERALRCRIEKARIGSQAGRQRGIEEPAAIGGEQVDAAPGQVCAPRGRFEE